MYIYRGVRVAPLNLTRRLFHHLLSPSETRGTIPIVRKSSARGTSQRATIGISMALSRRSRVLTHLQFVPTAQPLRYSISDTSSHFAPWRQPSSSKVHPTPPECRTTFLRRVYKLRWNWRLLVAPQLRNTATWETRGIQMIF